MRGRSDSLRDISAKLSGEVLRFAAFFAFGVRKTPDWGGFESRHLFYFHINQLYIIDNIMLKSSKIGEN